MSFNDQVLNSIQRYLLPQVNDDVYNDKYYLQSQIGLWIYVNGSNRYSRYELIRLILSYYI